MEQGFITLFISSTWCAWKMEPGSSCLRPLIIKEVKCLGDSKHVCRFLELTSVCPCIVSLISKIWGGNRCCAVSKEWEQWLWMCELFGDAVVTGGWKYKVLLSLFLVPFMCREGVQPQVCYFIYLSSFKLFLIAFPPLSARFLTCLGRWFLHSVWSVSFTCAWTSFPYEFYFIQCKSTPNYPRVSGGFPLD